MALAEPDDEIAMGNRPSAAPRSTLASKLSGSRVSTNRQLWPLSMNSASPCWLPRMFMQSVESRKGNNL